MRKTFLRFVLFDVWSRSVGHKTVNAESDVFWFSAFISSHHPHATTTDATTPLVFCMEIVSLSSYAQTTEIWQLSWASPVRQSLLWWTDRNENILWPVLWLAQRIMPNPCHEYTMNSSIQFLIVAVAVRAQHESKVDNCKLRWQYWILFSDLWWHSDCARTNRARLAGWLPYTVKIVVGGCLDCP